MNKSGKNNLLQLPRGKKKHGNDSGSNGNGSGLSNGRALSTFPIFDKASDECAESGNTTRLANGAGNGGSAQLSSRVTFSEESVADADDDEPAGSSLGGIRGSESAIADITDAVEDENRESWDNKTQFSLGVISYAVGFGNVSCTGAFLIPYMLMMILEGVPLFLIELGMGQRLQTGPVGVWNAIHPYLGGVGVSGAIVSYFVSLYYNVILTWVIYYLYKSINISLPWGSCPTSENGTALIECVKSSTPTNYFWNREAIDTSDSIGEFKGFNMHITLCLIFAWTLIYLCVMKGIKSSGKVMYLTATFPYVVTTVFLIRSLALEGAMSGLLYMLHPDLSRLYDPEVWLEAATQIFYSMGLGFGGLIAFASYNPLKNNCKRDCVLLSAANLATSLYTALVIFCVLGYMGHKNYMQCIESDMMTIMDLYPDKFSSLAEVRGNISVEEYVYWVQHNFHLSEFPLMAEHSRHCNYETIIEQAAEGSGLAFVVFTEAILQFPFPPLWAILFFMMLLTLGLGSMFGTLEGVITSLNDSKVIRVEKPVLTGFLCGSACLVGLIFSTRAGQYWVSLFDHFAGTYALMCVAFFEIIAVVYIYGWRRFCRDLEFMTGEPIGLYWTTTWRYISPTIMFIIFTCSVIKSFATVPRYLAYDSTTTHNHYINYPTWALFIAFGLVVTAMAPVPFILFVRKFKIWKVEGDIPAASKRLGSTPSTTYMLKSQMSFNRMVESTASELQTVGLHARSAANTAANHANNVGGQWKNGTIGVSAAVRSQLASKKEKNSSENINSTALSPPPPSTNSRVYGPTRSGVAAESPIQSEADTKTTVCERKTIKGARNKPPIV